MIGKATDAVVVYPMMRVAAVQFTASSDPVEYQATCMRLIAAAAETHAQLLVLPAICYGPRWAEKATASWTTALSLDDPLLTAIAERARLYGCYIITAATVRGQYPQVAETPLLFGPDGSYWSEFDTAGLTCSEEAAGDNGWQPARVVNAGLARIGLCVGEDSCSFDYPRVLALQGAQLLCNPLYFDARKGASLHLPVRAAENRVFVIAAHHLQPHSSAVRPGPENVASSGLEADRVEPMVSQIIAPDGRVLARTSGTNEDVIWVDIEPSHADSKLRPDGSDLFFNRRPSLYGEILQPPAIDQQQRSCGVVQATQGLNLAVVNVDADNVVQRLQQALDKLSQLPDTVQLVMLPELFWLSSTHLYPLSDTLEDSRQVQAALLQFCAQHDMYICTSLITANHKGLQHCGVLLGPEGIEILQPQLHCAARYGWHQAGEKLITADLPWGRVAILTGDDSCYPELVKVAALKGVKSLLVPFGCQESWESSFGLLSRATENRMCVIACSRSSESGLIANASGDLTLTSANSHTSCQIDPVSIVRCADATLVAPCERNADGEPNVMVGEHRRRHRSWSLAAEICACAAFEAEEFDDLGIGLM